VVYALSAEWRRSLPLEYLRLGRQVSEHGLPITSTEDRWPAPVGTPALAVWLRGRTVHFFETQPGLFENWVTCAGAVYRPSEHIRSKPTRASSTTRSFPGRTAKGLGLCPFLWSDLSTRFQESWGKLFVRGLDRSASHAGRLAPRVSVARRGIDAQASAQLRTLAKSARTKNPFYSLLGPACPTCAPAWKSGRRSRSASSPRSAARGMACAPASERDREPFQPQLRRHLLSERTQRPGGQGSLATGILEWNYVPGP